MLKRRIALSALLIALIAVLSIIAYNGVSRWPTGAAVGGPVVATTRPTVKSTLRLATFNIHSAVGTDGKADLERVANVLKSADADLIGLNEVRGGVFNQVLEIAPEFPMTGLYSPNERTLFHDNFGNGLLTRIDIDTWQRVPMPGTQSDHHRNVLIVHTKLGDSPFTVLIAHVARGPDRAAQLDYLSQLFDSTRPPVVLMGDLNTTRDDPLLASLLRDAIDPLKDKPHDDAQRIDWILGRGVRSTHAAIVPNIASDHPMVWADLELAR